MDQNEQRIRDIVEGILEDSRGDPGNIAKMQKVLQERNIQIYQMRKALAKARKIIDSVLDIYRCSVCGKNLYTIQGVKTHKTRMHS